MKIALFVGREHHAQKLSNLFNLLKLREHDVFSVIANNAINIDPASEFIWEYGEHKHLYEYLYNEIGQDTRARIEELMSYALDPSLSTSVPPFWTAYSIWEATESLILFERLIDQEKPDAVVVLHANNFWTRMFLYMAKRAEIKTYATQEGLLRHRDQKTLNKQSLATTYVDKLFTWSISDKNAYIDAGVNDDIVCPVGPIHLDGLATVEKDRYQEGFRVNNGIYHNLPIVAFCPPNSNLYQGDFAGSLHKVASYCNTKGFYLFVRLHPFDSKKDAVAAILEQYPNAKLFNDKPEILLLMADLVLTQHSTIAVEAAMLKTSVGIVDFDHIGILESPVAEGYGIEILSTDDIGLALSGEIAPKDLESWYEANGKLVDGKATERAVEIIENA